MAVIWSTSGTQSFHSCSEMSVWCHCFSFLCLSKPVNALDGHPVLPSHMSLGNSSTSTPQSHRIHSVLCVLCSYSMLVLGIPWLCTQNLIIDRKSVVESLVSCLQNCTSHFIQMNTTSIKSPQAHILVQIPLQYQSLREEVSTTRANWFPLHRLLDCAIEFLPGATPPLSQVLDGERVRTHQGSQRERETSIRLH